MPPTATSTRRGERARTHPTRTTTSARAAPARPISSAPAKRRMNGGDKRLVGPSEPWAGVASACAELLRSAHVSFWGRRWGAWNGVWGTRCVVFGALFGRARRFSGSGVTPWAAAPLDAGRGAFLNAGQYVLSVRGEERVLVRADLLHVQLVESGFGEGRDGLDVALGV